LHKGLFESVPTEVFFLIKLVRIRFEVTTAPFYNNQKSASHKDVVITTFDCS